jgi:hypothetical protein
MELEIGQINLGLDLLKMGFLGSDTIFLEKNIQNGQEAGWQYRQKIIKLENCSL